MKWASLVSFDDSKALLLWPLDNWVMKKSYPVYSCGMIEDLETNRLRHPVLWLYSVPETEPSAPRLHLNYLGRKGLQGL